MNNITYFILFGLVLLASAKKDDSVNTTTSSNNNETTTTTVKPTTTTTEEPEEKVRYTVTDEVWFDIAIKENKDSEEVIKKGRIVIALFGDVCPMTVTNFVQLAKGVRRNNQKLHYKGSTIHRIVRDFVVQGGDILNHDGSASQSIYGDKFIDENYVLSHRSPGWVSMANFGRDSNGSQFFITLVPARWLDGHHVVFGRVISGMSFVREIGETDLYKNSATPKKYIEIVASGTNSVTKYDLNEDLIDSPLDIRPE